ncbi:winged helix-turn-helix domain-containing protein [Brachybacterium huguangmaarense]
MPERLTWAQARRIALRSQGLGRSRRAVAPDRRASRAALRRTLARTHLLQIDSVSVFARAHHMPVFTRHGAWDPAVLEAAAAPGPHRLLTESFAHEAAYADLEVHRLLAFRRRLVAERDWGSVRRAAGEAELLEEIVALLRERGPLSASAVSRALGDHDRPADGWGWRRTTTQWAVEFLFRSGRLDCVGRSAQFERLYAEADPVVTVPAGGSAHAAVPDRTADTGDPEDPAGRAGAVLALVRRAADAQGIGTPAAIADHFRLPLGDVAPAIESLRASGELRDVVVARGGAEMPMLRWHEATGTGPVPGACLVSPFDPVAFFRPRLAALFDVEYRIGIYTPREKRTHGYYPLLVRVGDRFEARTDLRADRRRGVLEVLETHRELLVAMPRRGRPDDDAVARALAAELDLAARWQGLEAIEVAPRGDLAPALARALG